MYEAQTEAIIRQRMLDAIDSDLDKSEGSFLWDAVAAAAAEIAAEYSALDALLALGFVQTSSGSYLDYRAAEHGVTRLAATKSTGTVTVTGTLGTTVPLGSLFATPGGVQFASTAAATLAGTTADIAVQAVIAGITGNVPAATITVIPVAIPGISAVTNAALTKGGTDTETDAALVVRILEKVRLPATSGNVYHYTLWAKSVAGVGDARVLPLWDGNGTVKVVLIDSNKQPASVDIVTAAAAYIETVRPIGATVTVVAATALNINVSATLTLESGYVLAAVTAAIEAALTAYLAGIAFVESVVRYSYIANAILDTPGVLDYASLTVNSGTANISVATTEVAVKGTVTMS